MTSSLLQSARRLGRLLGVAAFLGLVAICATLTRADDDPLAEALAETDAEFRAVKDGVATAKDKIDEVEKNLVAAEEFLRDRPDLAPADPAERKRLLKTLGASRESLAKHADTLEKFGDYSGKVTDALDVVYEVDALQKAIASDDLSVQLRTLGEAMMKYGGKAPLIGKALEVYGEMTTGLVDATDRLHKEIVEVRNQGSLGSGTYGGQKDPRYQQLIRQFGREFAQSATFAPTSPREVFRPIDKPRSAVLLWDDDEGEWYRFDGGVLIETVFRDVRAARGDRPTVVQLKHLAENYAQIESRQAMAEAFRDYLRQAAAVGLSPRNEALPKAAGAGRVLLSLDDLDVFRARFVYDGQFRGGVLTVLDEMRIDMVKQGSSAKRSVAELDALVARHGVTLASQAAAKTATTSGSTPTAGGKPASAGKTASTQKAGEPPKPKDEQTEKLERRAKELAEKGLKPRDPNEKPDPNEARPIVPEDCEIEITAWTANNRNQQNTTRFSVRSGQIVASVPDQVNPAYDRVDSSGCRSTGEEWRGTYRFEGRIIPPNVISGTWKGEWKATQSWFWDSKGKLVNHRIRSATWIFPLDIELYSDGTLSWRGEHNWDEKAVNIVGDDKPMKIVPKKIAGSGVWQIRSGY
ncbi:MAG: hypothetical protein NTW96_18800 [Planctomycetia bacterium]|nr:hypothetical protein [Planctomycetia bacterium]